MVADTSNRKLSAQEIGVYAVNAGFEGDGLITAVAIALAESGGETGAYNPELQAGTPVGQGSYGLWQIYLKAHPEFSSWDLYDPQSNANAAFKVSRNGSTFEPWSTYNSDAYLKYMDRATAEVSV